jgi:hypothetical protein
VPSIISTAMAVLYGRDQEPVRRAALPSTGLNLDLMSTEEIQRMVYESLRLYPGVVGFPVVSHELHSIPRSLTRAAHIAALAPAAGVSRARSRCWQVPTTQSMSDGPRVAPLQPIPSDYLANPATSNLADHTQHRTAYLLAAALRDPAIWGDQTTEFVLRNKTLYEQNADVAWAHPATRRTTPGASFPSSTGVDPRSRGCPAKDLSFIVAVAWFQAIKDTTGAVAWEHPDPSVLASDNGRTNNAIAFTDVTPFISDFVLRRTVPTPTDPRATINPGAYGCTSNDDCMPINSQGVRQCFIPSHGPGKCLAEPGSLGPNTICYLDQECAQSNGAATCERSIVNQARNFLWPVAGLCRGLQSQTEVEAPLPENKCTVDHNPDSCDPCLAAGSGCAWCFAYPWSAANGRCLRNASSCPSGSVYYASHTAPQLFVPTVGASLASFQSRTLARPNAVEVQPWNLTVHGTCPSMVLQSRCEAMRPYVMQQGNLFESVISSQMHQRFNQQTDFFNRQMYSSCVGARQTWMSNLPTAARSIANYEPAYKYQDGYRDSFFSVSVTRVHTADFGGIQVCDYDEDWEAMGLSERIGRTIFNFITTPELADSRTETFGDFVLNSGASGSSGGTSDSSRSPEYQEVKGRAESQCFFNHFYGRLNQPAQAPHTILHLPFSDHVLIPLRSEPLLCTRTQAT